MTSTIETAKKVEILALIGAVVTLTVVAAPVISTVTTPIFAAAALKDWIDHRSLYNKTLTHGKRAKYGRIEGQDYTRWDGKTITKKGVIPIESERLHDMIGLYIHGKDNLSFLESAKQIEDYPFKDPEDTEWLLIEYERRLKKNQLEKNLRLLRGFSKTIIPLVGLIWAGLTETPAKDSSEIGCRACLMDKQSKQTHWSWQDAITFHRQHPRGLHLEDQV